MYDEIVNAKTSKSKAVPKMYGNGFAAPENTQFPTRAKELPGSRIGN